MNIMVQSYSGVHGSDTFFPGTEPLPGTYVCRFCLNALADHPGVHAFACYKQALFQSLKDRVDDQYPVSSGCTAVVVKSEADRRHRKKGVVDPATVCGTAFGSTDKSTDHAIYHAQSHVRPLFPGLDGAVIKYTFEGCHDSETPFQSRYYAEHVQHLFFAHNTRVEGHRAKTLEAELVHLTWWCPFCCEFIVQDNKDISCHILNHSLAYDEVFYKRGYLPVCQNTLVVWPMHCPVCVRDTGKSPMERFKPPTYSNNQSNLKGLLRHLIFHFESIDPLSMVSCPFSASTPDGIIATCKLTSIPMSSLYQHLLEGHGWDLKQVVEALETERQAGRARHKARQAAKQKRKDDGLEEDGTEQRKQLVPLGGSDVNVRISPRKPAAKKKKQTSWEPAEVIQSQVPALVRAFENSRRQSS